MKSIFNFSIFLLAFVVTIAWGVTAHAYSLLNLSSAEQALAPLSSLVTDGAGTVITPKMVGCFSKSATSNLVAPLATADAVGLRVAMKGLGVTALKAVPLVGIGLTGYMAYTDIKSLINGHESTYPNLSTAFKVQTNTPYNLVSGDYSGQNFPHTVGTKMTYNGTTYQLTSFEHLTSGGCSTVCQPADKPPAFYTNYPYSGYMMVVQNYNYGQKDIWNFSPSSPVTPVYAPATDAQATANLGGASGLSTNQNNEMVDMARANPSKVQVPEDVLKAQAIQAQLDAEASANRQAQIDALTSAKEKYDLLCTNNPGSEYCAKAKEVESDLNNAKKEQYDEQVKAENDKVANVTNNAYDSTVVAPEKKDISSRITGFVSQSPIGNFIQSFGWDVSNPDPVVQLGSEYGRDYSVDFSEYEGHLNAVGLIILGCAQLSAIFIVMRKPSTGGD